MKLISILVSTVIVSTVVFSQELILISPDGEAIPVKQEKNAPETIRGLSQSKQIAVGTNECPQPPQGGGVCPPLDPCYDTNFGYNAGDVAATILIAPFSGVIRIVSFVTQSNTLPSGDTNCTISIFKVLPGWAASGDTWFGYFPDSNNTHTGRSPYPDPATGQYVPGDSGTGNIFGENLWGGEIGGYPSVWPNHPTIVSVRMMDLGYEPVVQAGDTFAVCIRTSIAPHNSEAPLAVMRATSRYPGNFFKYYDHDRVPGKPGWWRLSGYNMFILATIWASGDVPPTVTRFSTVRHTVSTDPQPVELTAFDCNLAVPADTGVASANVYYRVDAGSYSSIPMTVSNFLWSADIPGQPVGSTVTYYADATDIHGYTTTVPAKSYRVVDLYRAGYVYSTPAFSFTNIAGDAGATELPGSAFQGTGAEDDGTAGPVPIGGNFNFFGRDTMRYVWVSVNGGIGMTGTVNDTVWVNSNATRTGGFANFSIPGTAPRNWIAPFWTDLYLAPGGHGSVWYKQVGTQLIIQYNRVGNFNDSGDTTTTFQVVLDRADSSVTFKYLDVGTTGLETQGYVAMQASTTGLWTFLNQFGYPVETRPANNTSIKLTYNGPTGVEDRGGELPAKFALHANYPNPFNPATKIRYELPRQVNVTLKVFNLLGQEVSTLVNEVQSVGKYVVEFHGENLSSGVYFYRLQAGDFVQTKKLVLMK